MVHLILQLSLKISFSLQSNPLFRSVFMYHFAEKQFIIQSIWQKVGNSCSFSLNKPNIVLLFTKLYEFSKT